MNETDCILPFDYLPLKQILNYVYDVIKVYKLKTLLYLFHYKFLKHVFDFLLN